MADIIEVTRADRAHIMRCQDRFRELSSRAGPGARQAQGAAGASLASLIELHLAAEDEICRPVIYRAGPPGPARARDMLQEHEDIREIIREACLQPAGSRLWRQLATAVLQACTRQLDREDHVILADLDRAGPAARHPRAWATLKPVFEATLGARIDGRETKLPLVALDLADGW